MIPGSQHSIDFEALCSRSPSTVDDATTTLHPRSSSDDQDRHDGVLAHASSSLSSFEINNDEKLSDPDHLLPPKVFERKYVPFNSFSNLQASSVPVVRYRTRLHRPQIHLAVFISLAAAIIVIFIGWDRGRRALYGPLGPHYDTMTLLLPDNKTLWSFPLPESCYQEPGSLQGIDIRVTTSLSFAGAKFVDLAWNWVVGRGVQVILAWLAYRAFSDALVKAAEGSHVTTEHFLALAMFATQLDTLWSLMAGFRQASGWRVRLLVAWAVASTVFLASFPALMDLSTGYETVSILNMKAPGGYTVQLADAKGVLAGIVENVSTLLKLQTTPMNVTVPWKQCFHADGTVFHDLAYIKRMYSDSFGDWWNVSDPCGANLTAYGSYEQDDRLWIREYMRLHSQPVLVKNWIWPDTELQRAWDAVYNASLVQRFANRTAFSAALANARGDFPRQLGERTCQVLQQQYVWGFAYVWLSVALFTTAAWLVGLWVLWVDAYHNSAFARKRRRMGAYRAALDLAGALTEALGPHTGGYSNAELERHVRKLPPVKYFAEPDASACDGGDKIGLSARQSARVRLKWNHEYS